MLFTTAGISGASAEAAKLFEESGDHLALAWSLNHQGDIARQRGDTASARRLYDEALSRFRSLNERLGVAGSLHDLACLAADAGDHRAATSLDREALELYCALGRKGDIPRVLEALAVSAAATGNAGHALRFAGCAAATRKTYGLYLTETTEMRLAESLDRARRQMDGAEAAASWMAGWNMRPEQAAAFALATENAARSLQSERLRRGA